MDPPTIPTAGLLTVDQLRDLANAGEIDTVIVGFADMQGRLVGKRISGVSSSTKSSTTASSAAITSSPSTWR